MISDLPRDVAEEVLSWLPVTSLGGVRSTCKKWNTLTKDDDFIKKHLGKNQRRKVVMLLDYKVYLMSVDLLTPPSIERIGKLVSLNHKDPAAAADRVEISSIFHCDGLLLCITKGSQLVVWNPYSGKTRWIEPRDSYNRFDTYALGYSEKNNCSLPRSHKVLRFVDFYDWSLGRGVHKFELYSFNSNSWKVVDVNPDWTLGYYQRGVSLKGNTYWFAQEKLSLVPRTDLSDLRDFLLCFDFTKERFGPRLPLPFHSFDEIVTISSVREEQLAVLYQEDGISPYTVKIWISSKIEPNAVSWNKLFLNVDMKPLTGFLFHYTCGSFFVDEEEEEVAVVLDEARDEVGRITSNIACIIGKNSHFKQVDLGGLVDPSLDLPTYPYRSPPVFVCSYVPSSVEIL
ncbi:F-box/kelch-repeat protein At3g16740-like [Raphanus sativus]|uniref:F-box/kelch-repeat protein At3g16740-like n=1 Tax=Raphanus sativus TaxID=3726 RepID=A0A6J0NS03_RAPSA|nr:F-box/kelch-repeat protein At3g16740-like [Raphanus sativus]